MRIKSVQIQNFRTFEDETINLDSYTCLVGPNGSGKSTVLTALNIFFRESAGSSTNLLELQKEDFHGGNTLRPITITLTFMDLSEDAQKDFSDYFRQNQLVVSAVASFDAETKRAFVRQSGQRTGMAEFRKFFEVDKQRASVEELISFEDQLRQIRESTQARYLDAFTEGWKFSPRQGMEELN
jgi:putative ATP-dependent endonuclease of the OLD family